jgi:hypothetical protein
MKLINETQKIKDLNLAEKIKDEKQSIGTKLFKNSGIVKQRRGCGWI